MTILQTRLAELGFDPGGIDRIDGPKTYAALFRYMGAGDNAALFGAAAAQQFPAYRLNNPYRISHWLAQFGHESCGFTQLEEDLSYSPSRLCKVWPRRFPDIASASPYSYNPQLLAEKVYGGRMGNDQPGDGWLFRGRGPQLTGRYNYTSCAARTGLDLVNHPELAAEPANFVKIACDFWDQSCCNLFADLDDITTITRRINGALIGLDARTALLRKAERALLP